MSKCASAVLVTCLVVVLLSTTVCAEPHQDKTTENPFRKSTFFRKLADAINDNPKAHWRAAVGEKIAPPLTNITSDHTPHIDFLIFNEIASKGVNYAPNGVRTATGVDWRLSGKLTAPDHQGKCGSCWIFASVHTVMDCKAVKSGSENSNTQNRLSVQHVLECCKGLACAGCRGAVDNAAAFDYLTREFTVDQTCKVYVGSDQFCSRNCQPIGQLINQVPHYSINGFRRLSSNVNEIKQALNTGPVLAAMEIYSDLYTYQYGIYEHFDNTYIGRHSVELVGYGNENGRDFWIVKNSWGRNWGEHGYFRIVAGQNEAQIEEHVIIPILSALDAQDSSEKDLAISSPLGGSDDASVISPDILDAAQYVANEINPLCRDGKLDGASEYGNVAFTVDRILKASRQIIEGISYELLMEVSLPAEVCEVRMFVEASVHMFVTGEFGDLSFRYVPPENVVANSSVEKTGCFALVLLMVVFGVLFVAKF